MITTLILKLQNDLCCTYEFMSKLCSCFNLCTHIKFSLKLSPTNDFVQSVNNAFLNKLNYIKSFILCVFFFYIKINLSLLKTLSSTLAIKIIKSLWMVVL